MTELVEVLEEISDRLWWIGAWLFLLLVGKDMAGWRK
jgi:hypothetical protein